MNHAVLVGIREFAEMPERASGVLPCAAALFRHRLLAPDDVDGLTPDSIKLLSNSAGVESAGANKDRKLMLRCRLDAIFPNQGMDSMVENDTAKL